MLEKGEFDLEEDCCKNKHRGAGPPKKALEVRYALFDYFIDIKYSLKGRLTQRILLSKAKQSYEGYCVLKAEAGEEPEKLKITRKWLQKWCKDYRISLKYPNKQFSITQEVRKRRIIQFFKKVWTARYWWKAKYKVDPPILLADQMPLHRNESGRQKSLNFFGGNQSCFVKKKSSPYPRKIHCYDHSFFI